MAIAPDPQPVNRIAPDEGRAALRFWRGSRHGPATQTATLGLPELPGPKTRYIIGMKLAEQSFGKFRRTCSHKIVIEIT